MADHRNEDQPNNPYINYRLFVFKRDGGESVNKTLLHHVLDYISQKI